MPEDSSKSSPLSCCYCSWTFGIAPKCKNIGCHFPVTASFRRSSDSLVQNSSEWAVQLDRSALFSDSSKSPWVQGGESWTGAPVPSFIILLPAQCFVSVKGDKEIKKRGAELHIIDMSLSLLLLCPLEERHYRECSFYCLIINYFVF